jgi:hypothetical protein
MDSSAPMDWDAVKEVGLEVQQPFSQLLLAGTKTIETRAYSLPAALLGRPITLIETPQGVARQSSLGNADSKPDAKVIGTITFSECFAYTVPEQWQTDEARHCVLPSSAYAWNGESPIFGWVVDPASDAIVASPCPQPAPPIRRIFRSLFEVARATDGPAGLDEGGAVALSYTGRAETVALPASGRLSSLFEAAACIFDLPPECYSLKLVSKGKSLDPESYASASLPPVGAAPAKVMVIASARGAVEDMQAAHSDPGVLSFAAEHGSRHAKVPVSVGVRQGKMRRAK